MEYSKSDTEQLAQLLNSTACLEDINTLICREGCGETIPVFPDNIVVLDMDCVENIFAFEEQRYKAKSMDCVYVVTDDTTGNKMAILAEFRFNYTSMRNLTRNSLLDKVIGSSNLLSANIPIYNEYYYIFDKNIKQQAINRFRRMNPSIPQHYIACDINDLRNLGFN